MPVAPKAPAVREEVDPCSASSEGGREGGVPIGGVLSNTPIGRNGCREENMPAGNFMAISNVTCGPRQAGMVKDRNCNRNSDVFSGCGALPCSVFLGQQQVRLLVLHVVSLDVECCAPGQPYSLTRKPTGCDTGMQIGAEITQEVQYRPRGGAERKTAQAIPHKFR